MNKKQLPIRKNKGKNAFNTSWKFIPPFRTKTKNSTLNNSLKLQDKNHSQVSQIKLKQIQRKQMYVNNKRQFKYTRGIHYFYNLHQLTRLINSPSYVLFDRNTEKKSAEKTEFKINFSQQHLKIGNSLISEIINRDYIGLPQSKNKRQSKDCFDSSQQTASKQCDTKLQSRKTLLIQQELQQQQVQLNYNHKNICHHYLFANQDRKHFIDLQINQCEYIKKKFKYYLTHRDRLKQFSFVEKDNDLYELLEQNLNDDQKYQVLIQKIDNLKQKKAKCQKVLKQKDNLYFASSLNQVLYNKIKQNNQKLLKSQVYNQLIKVINSDCFKKKSRSNKKENQRTKITNEYRFVQKHCFDQLILKYATRLVSIRICEEGEHIFYRARSTFIKVFQIQLQLEKEIKPINQELYIKKCKQICRQITCFYQNNNKLSACIDYNLNNKQKAQTKIKLNQKTVQITMEDFFYVKIFTSIYNSLFSIKDYLKKSSIKSFELIDLLGSLFFSKFQNLFNDGIQNELFGMLPHCLDILCQFLNNLKQHFQQVDWSMFSQYNKNSICIFLRQTEWKDNVKEQVIQKGRKRAIQRQYLSEQQVKSLQIMTKRCNR